MSCSGRVACRNVFLFALVVVCYQVHFAENCFIVARIEIFCACGSESLKYGFCYILSVFANDLIGCILNADEQIFVRTEHVLYLQILSAHSAGPNVSRRFQMKSLFESIYNHRPPKSLIYGMGCGKIYFEFLYPFAYPSLFSFDGLRIPSQKGTFSGAKP